MVWILHISGSLSEADAGHHMEDVDSIGVASIACLRSSLNTQDSHDDSHTLVSSDDSSSGDSRTTDTSHITGHVTRQHSRKVSASKCGRLSEQTQPTAH